MAKMFPTIAPPNSFGGIGTKDECGILNSRVRNSKLEKGVVSRANGQLSFSKKPYEPARGDDQE